jgi:hypothetical protein
MGKVSVHVVLYFIEGKKSLKWERLRRLQDSRLTIVTVRYCIIQIEF